MFKPKIIGAHDIEEKEGTHGDDCCDTRPGQGPVGRGKEKGQKNKNKGRLQSLF
jgi:hypothetical protein